MHDDQRGANSVCTLNNIIQEHNNTGSWYTLLMSKGELTLCAQTNIIQEHNNTSSCYTLFIYYYQYFITILWQCSLIG
jgi:hypothetical protein